MELDSWQACFGCGFQGYEISLQRRESEGGPKEHGQEQEVKVGTGLEAEGHIEEQDWKVFDPVSLQIRVGNHEQRWGEGLWPVRDVRSLLGTRLG